MGELILVVGGSRSGKSDYAQERAEAIAADRFFLATCPPPADDDPEMAARVKRHREQRRGRGWQTREETLALSEVVRELPDGATVLIDCLTLWISNLLLAAHRRGDALSEAALEEMAGELVHCCRERAGTVIMVSNEVGCGTVPEHALARCYRDLVGRCNRTVAEAADRVVLVSCGIPVRIKG